MARAESVTCDICGRVKGEVNHWFIALAPSRPDYVAFSPDKESLRQYAQEQQLNVQDICSAECAHKRLQRTLDAQKTPAQPQEAQ